ncbi:Condensation domain protein, partial [Candidatus Thiomargarita nelsonii]
ANKRLVAYLVLNMAQEAMPNTLRRFIKDKLPDYMVPSAFVKLEAMPLTPNGKVDRRKLSQLSVSREPLSEETFVAPRTSEEELLAGILAELLSVERVGIYDNFFELGGHSLLATQFISQVRDVLQAELPFHCVFNTPTVADLAKLIEVGRQKKPFPPIQPIPRNDALPLSFSQERVWLIQQLVPDNLAYNFQFTLLFEGLLDVATLEQSLSEIVRRHEIYRTTFPTRDGRPIQIIHQAQPVKLQVVDLQALSDREYEVE